MNHKAAQIYTTAIMEKTFLNKFMLKKIFSKTRRPISITLDVNYPCIKEIQVCLEKGTDPHKRGDNNKNANIGWGNLKILFSRTNDSEKFRFT
jgi:hypothetical protein